jgi:hypothetical protein
VFLRKKVLLFVFESVVFFFNIRHQTTWIERDFFDGIFGRR